MFPAVVAVVLERPPSRREGYTLDLDSTRLLHEDGHQEGVQPGHTRIDVKPCPHPLLAILAETLLVFQVWLRAVCADSGFCVPELLAFWEQMHLSYIVVSRFTVPIQHLIRHDIIWTPTELADSDVAEIQYQMIDWPHPRRFVLIRDRLAARPGVGGRKLFDVPGYAFQALVTNLPPTQSPLAVCRDYNGRAECENVIKELQQGFALPTLCLRSFWATEAAL